MLSPRTVIIIFALLITLPLLGFLKDSYTGKVVSRTAIYAHHDSTMTVDLHNLIDAEHFVLFDKGKLKAELLGSQLIIKPSVFTGSTRMVVYADNHKLDVDVVVE